MRLIDADALEQAVQEGIAEYADGYTGEMIFGMRSVVYYASNVIPTVDAVPVIRCKDCKYWTVTSDDYYQSCECDALIRHKDFYCARAERKEDGKAD